MVRKASVAACGCMLVVMLVKELREAVLEANLELVRRGLVLYTFGNASGVDLSLIHI